MQFFKTDLAKQVLGNPKLSVSLYVPSNLAGLFDRKKICPWTAVQQDTQRLRKARGLGVLQSVSLAEINQGGSALAPWGPSPPCVKAAGLREKPTASDTSPCSHTVDYRPCSRDGKLSNTFAF